jgi:membrane protein
VTVAGWIERARSFVREELWSEQERQSRPSLIGLLQFSIMVVQGFVRDHLLLRASALAYFTVLSVVPLLAVAVSIAGAVGVGSEGFVEQVVGTLAAVSPEAQTTIRGLIERANFGGLGTLSAAVLFLTTVLAIGQVEAAFNGIWGVTHSRPVSRRFSDYLAVLVVGPLLGGVTLSLSTTMKSQAAVQFLLDIPIFATFFDFGLSQAPVVVLTLVFGFLYWFLPNTRVRPLSALLGAVPAAVLTLVAQNLYVDFSVGVTRASAFFGTFSALALLFVWIYKREAIGLRIVLEVARRFRDCAPPIDAGELSDTLRAPVRVVRDVVSRLCGSQILSQRTEETRRDLLQLGQPAEGIKVVDVLTSLRGERDPTGGDAALAATVESVISEIEENAVKSAAGRTVADLLEGIPPLADVDRKRASG